MNLFSIYWTFANFPLSFSTPTSCIVSLDTFFFISETCPNRMVRLTMSSNWVRSLPTRMYLFVHPTDIFISYLRMHNPFSARQLCRVFAISPTSRNNNARKITFQWSEVVWFSLSKSHSLPQIGRTSSVQDACVLKWPECGCEKLLRMNMSEMKSIINCSLFLKPILGLYQFKRWILAWVLRSLISSAHSQFPNRMRIAKNRNVFSDELFR